MASDPHQLKKHQFAFFIHSAFVDSTLRRSAIVSEKQDFFSVNNHSQNLKHSCRMQPGTS